MCWRMRYANNIARTSVALLRASGHTRSTHHAWPFVVRTTRARVFCLWRRERTGGGGEFHSNDIIHLHVYLYVNFFTANYGQDMKCTLHRISHSTNGTYARARGSPLRPPSPECAHLPIFRTLIYAIYANCAATASGSSQYDGLREQQQEGDVHAERGADGVGGSNASDNK